MTRRGSGKGQGTATSLPAFDPNPSAQFGSDLLREACVPFALIGRIAMWSMLPEDQHEFTKDVDFAVPLRFRETIRRALRQRHVTPHELAIGGLAVRENEIRVDFIDRGDGGLDALFEEAIVAAQKASTNRPSTPR